VSLRMKSLLNRLQERGHGGIENRLAIGVKRLS